MIVRSWPKCLVIVLVMICSAASSAEKLPVVWGGVAISTFGKDTLAPVAQRLLNCDSPSPTNTCPIDDFAKKIVLETPFDKVEVVNTYADDRVSYLVSPVIDAEWVSRVKLSEGVDRYVYQFLIIGSLVVYEVSPAETSLLSSVPVSIYADFYFSQPLTLAQEEKAFEAMYLSMEPYKGQAGYYNFFNNLVSEAKPILDRPLKFSSSSQFTKVGYSDDVVPVLKANNDLNALSRLFAAWATVNLAQATGEPIIPATLGKNDLKLVFRDASRTLILPKPMYEFDMYVQGVGTYKNAKYTCFNVGAYYGVKAFDEMLVDAPVEHGDSSCAFLEAGSADPGNIYPANLLAQIQQVMFGFSSNPEDRKYLSSHISTDRNKVLKSFEKIRKEVFNGN